MKGLTALLLAAMSAGTAHGFACPPLARTTTHTTAGTTTSLRAGGWGNNQARSVADEEVGGVNGSPIYDEYKIEDRGEFMQRVDAERKSLRIRKAADLLEVARIAGVELKRKVRTPTDSTCSTPRIYRVTRITSTFRSRRRRLRCSCKEYCGNTCGCD